jgi:hypothetical protein
MVVAVLGGWAKYLPFDQVRFEGLNGRSFVALFFPVMRGETKKAAVSTIRTAQIGRVKKMLKLPREINRD